jgi:hypothetical protein
LAITKGWPPSIIATAEFVVPKSIPIITFLFITLFFIFLFWYNQKQITYQIVKRVNMTYKVYFIWQFDNHCFLDNSSLYL